MVAREQTTSDIGKTTSDIEKTTSDIEKNKSDVVFAVFAYVF